MTNYNKYLVKKSTKELFELGKGTWELSFKKFSTNLESNLIKEIPDLYFSYWINDRKIISTSLKEEFKFWLETNEDNWFNYMTNLTNKLYSFCKDEQVYIISDLDETYSYLKKDGYKITQSRFDEI